MVYSQTMVWEKSAISTGIYKAYKRWSETSSVEPRVLLNNIQAWLSIFGFSTSASGILSAIWRWFLLSKLPPPLIIGVLFVLGAFVLVFFVLTGMSIVVLFRMLCHSIKGVHHRFNASTTSINVLEAIEPTHEHTNLKGYKIAVDRFTKERSKLYSLITKYEKVIRELESDNAKLESKGEKRE